VSCVYRRVAEPFCGAGGLALGLERAGFRGVWAADKDRHARATFRAAFPDVPVVDEVTGDEPAPADDLDLIAGGPPCQPFSHAGNKHGQWDPRDGFPLFLSLAARWRPRAVLLENVRGLLAPRNAHYVAAIVRALEELGYTVRYRLLQAADYGVPQRRERVFFVGFLDDQQAARFRWPEPTHSLEALVVWKATGGYDESAYTRYERAVLRRLRARMPRAGTKARAARDEASRAAAQRLPWVTVREALGDLVREFVPGETLHTPPSRGNADVELVDAGRGGRQGAKDTSRDKSLLYKRTRPDVPADTVSAAAEQKGSEHCARIALRVKNGRHRTSERNIDTPSSTVAASWSKEILQVVVRNLGAGDGLGAKLDDPAPTVPASVGGQAGLAAMDGASVHEYIGSEDTTEPGRVHRRPSTVLRRLSHAEVARLQSFPDDWPWQGPSTAVYRQIGNAVPPPLAEAVGRAITRALEG